MANNPRTTEQLRAERALACVKEIARHSVKDQKNYRSLAIHSPAHIQTNGLGQTLAFWRSKKDKELANVLYDDVSKWICERMSWKHDQNDHALTHLTQCSTSDYRRATVETMAFLNWLKRFAEAELKSGETGDD